MGRHISIVAGEEHVEIFTVLDAAGDPQDITGAYCYLGVWRPSSNSQILQRDNDPNQSNAGIVLTTPLSGIVTATIARANTSSEATEGVDVDAIYQFWVRLLPLTDDDPTTTQSGVFTIRQSLVTFS